MSNAPRRAALVVELAGLSISVIWLTASSLFIDHHNVYKGARESFFAGVYCHFTDGQVDPSALGELICSRPPPGFERVLPQVRVYTGRPDATRDPKSYWPHMHQCAAWERAGVKVIPRELKYPEDFPVSRPKEKGVDVVLAVDFVSEAIAGSYDVGVIVSTDTDLRPALEYVSKKYDPYPRAEVAAWTSPTSNARIPFDGRYNTWCHYLNRSDYDAVHDPTDYTRP